MKMAIAPRGHMRQVWTLAAERSVCDAEKGKKRWAHASGSNIQEPRIKTYPVLQFASAGSRFETEMLNWCTQRNLADSHTKTSQASARTMVTKIKGTMAVIGTHIPVSERL